VTHPAGLEYDLSLNKNSDGSYPAPKPANEAERLTALQQYRVLDTLPEAVYDDLVFIASQICQTPIALVSLVDGDRQWFKAKVGLDAEQTPRDLAFCAHAILQPDEVFQVPDATRDERFNTNPLVTSDPSIRFYAGVPLVTADGLAVGTLCAIDRTPRELSVDQQRALRALSREVMMQMELRRTIASLEQSLATANASKAAAKPSTGTASSTEADDRIRSLLLRMQQLQKRGNTPPTQRN
jgi:GAF domain-containing protein